MFRFPGVVIPFVMAAALAACAGGPRQPGNGMAAWVDPVTGRQVVVETDSKPAATTPAVSTPAATAPALTPVQQEASPANLSLDAADHVDADLMDQELERRRADRFFMMPDGTGSVRTMKAVQLDPALRDETPGRPVAAGEGVGAAGAGFWQACARGGLVPGLADRKDSARRHVLSFPAAVGQTFRHGYRVPVPPGATDAAFSTVVGKGKAVHPVLAVLDDQGALVSVAYSQPTETVPETRFRYARVGFRVILPTVAGGQSLAVLDAVSAKRFLRACGLDETVAVPHPPSATGTVILEFPEHSVTDTP